MHRYSDIHDQDLRQLDSADPKLLQSDNFLAVTLGLYNTPDDLWLTFPGRTITVFGQDDFQGGVVESNEAVAVLTSAAVALGLVGVVHETLKIIRDQRINDPIYNARAFLRVVQDLCKRPNASDIPIFRELNAILPAQVDPLQLSYDDLRTKYLAVAAKMGAMIGEDEKRKLAASACKKVTFVTTSPYEKYPTIWDMPFDALTAEWWYEIFHRFQQTWFYKKIFAPGRWVGIMYQICFWVSWMASIVFTGNTAYAGIVGLSLAATFTIPAIAPYIYLTLKMRNNFLHWTQANDIKLSPIWDALLAPPSNNRWVNGFVDLLRVPVLLPFFLVPMTCQWIKHINSTNGALNDEWYLQALFTPVFNNRIANGLFDIVRWTILSPLLIIVLGVSIVKWCKTPAPAPVAQPDANDSPVVGAQAFNDNGVAHARFSKVLSTKLTYMYLQAVQEAKYNALKPAVVPDPMSPATDAKQVSGYGAAVTSATAAAGADLRNPLLNAEANNSDYKPKRDRITRLQNETRSKWKIAATAFVKFVSGFIATYFTTAPVLAFLELVCDVSIAAAGPWVLGVSTLCGIIYSLYFGTAKHHDLQSDRDTARELLATQATEFEGKQKTLFRLEARFVELQTRIRERLLSISPDKAALVPVSPIQDRRNKAPQFDEAAHYNNLNETGGDDSKLSLFCKFWNRFQQFMCGMGHAIFIIRALLIAGIVMTAVSFPVGLAWGITCGLIYGALIRMQEYRLRKETERDHKFLEELHIREVNIDEQIKTQQTTNNSLVAILAITSVVQFVGAVTTFNKEGCDPSQLNREEPGSVSPAPSMVRSLADTKADGTVSSTDSLSSSGSDAASPPTPLRSAGMASAELWAQLDPNRASPPAEGFDFKGDASKTGSGIVTVPIADLHALVTSRDVSSVLGGKVKTVVAGVVGGSMSVSPKQFERVADYNSSMGTLVPSS